MNINRIVLYSNHDKSYTVTIELDDETEFNVRCFSPSYEGHSMYPEAYKYAFALSGFLNVPYIDYDDTE